MKSLLFILITIFTFSFSNANNIEMTDNKYNNGLMQLNESNVALIDNSDFNVLKASINCEEMFEFILYLLLDYGLDEGTSIDLALIVYDNCNQR
jgi:hypothetical protein